MEATPSRALQFENVEASPPRATEASSVPAEPEMTDEELAMQFYMQEQEAFMQNLRAASMNAALTMNIEGDAVDEDMALAIRLMRDDVGTHEDDAADDEAAEGEADVDEMDYDELVDLGNRIGDVQSERWRGEAHQYIEQLSTFHPTPSKLAGLATKCVICQFEYEPSDECTQLPCQHDFHLDCVVNWLRDHPSCPVCKVSIKDAPTQNTSTNTGADTEPVVQAAATAAVAVAPTPAVASRSRPAAHVYATPATGTSDSSTVPLSANLMTPAAATPLDGSEKPSSMDSIQRGSAATTSYATPAAGAGASMLDLATPVMTMATPVMPRAPMRL